MSTRRGFLIGAAATAIGFGALYTYFGRGSKAPTIKINRYGPLVPDPGRVIDLPEGFSYTIVSRAGVPMIDGLLTPGRPDGMACFSHSDDLVILVLNHEIGDWDAGREVSPYGPDDALFPDAMAALVYDAGVPGRRTVGGTSTILYNLREKRLEHQFLSLGGTQVNCAGGQTPWGSWLSCEENFDGPRNPLQERHGYVFEVPASATPGLADPIPLKDMGRFVHEAACVDPATGIVYLTQDAGDSLFYRFIPNTPGNLKAGGTLQALVITERPAAVTSNRQAWGSKKISQNRPMAVSWVTLDNVDPDENDLAERGHAQGAAYFSRGEGIWFGEGELYFTSTDGGPSRNGQVWRHRPAPGGGTLELFIEPRDASVMENLDNITIAPWGDIIFCEDGPMPNYLRGLTTEGKIYDIAKSDYYRSEFAGACFSPDGRVLFVNLQDAHMTLAITGPWDALKA